MGRPQIRQFEPAHLEEAGRLLAAYHSRHRAAEPALARRFEDPTLSGRELESALDQPGGSGAVALLDDKVVGFLVGAPRPEETWGPNLWVQAAGSAAIAAEDLRDLYGFASARWVEEGRTAHYVVTRAFDRAAVDAWFRLGFGQQHVHALRESRRETNIPVPEAVTIRPGDSRDVEVLAALDLVLPEHQAGAPVFSSGPVPSFEEAVADWEESIEDPAYGVFVAEVDGKVVGSAVGASAEESTIHSGIARPDESAVLGFAAVFPEARLGGIGSALGRTVLDWAVRSGYPVTVTDWRVTNLLSSRTWPRLGFRETFLRLHRSIGY